MTCETVLPPSIFLSYYISWWPAGPRPLDSILGEELAPTHRTYEVPEANRVLPRVRRLVGQIAELSLQLPELQDELRIAE